MKILYWKFFIIISFNFCFSLTNADENKNIVGKEIEDQLKTAKITDLDNLLKWVQKVQMKDKPGSDSSSEVAIGTLKSKSSAGKHRIIFSKQYGQTIFSFFDGGKIELLVDSHSSNGFKPYSIQSEDKSLRVRPSSSCSDCHTSDFTPIWNLNASSDFTAEGKAFKAPLDSVSGIVSDSSANFINVLVKRSAKNLFEKIKSRHPDRFKKYAPLVLKLLLSCEVSEEQWNELTKEIQKEAPKILKVWTPILDGAKKHFAAPGGHKSYGQASIENSLHPLLLLHYLGVPPQNIFLFSALKDEEAIFQSMEKFSVLTEPLLDKTKRFGPLGAYAAENDDLRGHLAARLAHDIFPKSDYSVFGDYSRADVAAFLTVKPDLGYTGENRKKHSLYQNDPFFPFNIYGTYETPKPPDSKIPTKFLDKKKQWCEQINIENADYTSLENLKFPTSHSSDAQGRSH